MLMIPTKKAAIAKRAAESPGIASNRLLKNVIPPLCPDRIRRYKVVPSIKKSRISLTDHFPIAVFGYLKILLDISFSWYLNINKTFGFMFLIQ